MKKILKFMALSLVAGLLLAGCIAVEEQMEEYVTILEIYEYEEVYEDEKAYEDEDAQYIAEQTEDEDYICEPVYVTLGPPPPITFGPEITQLLEASAELLLTGQENAVQTPICYSIFAVAMGSMRDDGTDVSAITVAVERWPGDWSAERTLFVLLEDDAGIYRVRWQGGSLGGRAEGGMMGDSFAGIDIADGMLTISIFGGSSDRWGHDASFSIVDGQLVLSRLVDFSFSTHTAGGIVDIYYPDTGVIETRTFSGIDDFDNLLLAVSHTTPGQVFPFEENPLWLPWLPRYGSEEIRPWMPSLYRVPFGEPMHENVRLSATEALGMVREALFPHMEKMPIPYSQEILDNYRVILTYEIPAHFFTDGEFVLSYAGQNNRGRGSHNFGEGVFHLFWLRAVEGYNWHIITVNDETGEVVERPR